MHAEDAEVDRFRRAHREASDRVDDGPAATVRATVLAAAARAVDAQPRLVTPTPGARPRARRWSLAAAALLVVSVMTGLVATRIVRDSPERVTTIASAAPTERTARGAASPQADAAPPAAAEAPATAVAVPPPLLPKHAPARRERGTAAPAPSTSAVVAAPPAAPAAAPAALAKAEPDADALARAADAPLASNAEASSLRATTAMRARIGRTVEPATPEAWVERIVRLRAEGNDSDADRELDALRQRYPGFVIPATAAKATGTR